jgi:hypothetical protein
LRDRAAAPAAERESAGGGPGFVDRATAPTLFALWSGSARRRRATVLLGGRVARIDGELAAHHERVRRELAHSTY